MLDAGGGGMRPRRAIGLTSGRSHICWCFPFLCWCFPCRMNIKWFHLQKICSLCKLRVTVKFDPCKPQNTLLITKIQAVKCGFNGSHPLYSVVNRSTKDDPLIESSLKTTFLLTQRFLTVIKFVFCLLPYGCCMT